AAHRALHEFVPVHPGGHQAVPVIETQHIARRWENGLEL
ncbi:MAG: hypothetical protein ACI9MB_003923, partial [Verrucomicrobiales bacterium]